MCFSKYEKERKMEGPDMLGKGVRRYRIKIWNTKEVNGSASKKPTQIHPGGKTRQPLFHRGGFMGNNKLKQNPAMVAIEHHTYLKTSNTTDI